MFGSDGAAAAGVIFDMLLLLDLHSIIISADACNDADVLSLEVINDIGAMKDDIGGDPTHIKNILSPTFAMKCRNIFRYVHRCATGNMLNCFISAEMVV